MSTIKVTNLQNASAASPAIVLDANSRATLNGLSYPTAGSLGSRNRIINGAMEIDQRNAGASVTPTDGQYVVDRWQAYQSTASKISAQRSTTAPAGFINSFLVTSLSAYTVGANDVYGLAQGIEGFNVADLGWGTASAQSVTISFWVRSSVTGTFGGVLRNNAGNRAYAFTYTVNAANTFEYKTVTIAGDTTGTWTTDNTAGIRLIFDLGTGSTYRVAAGSWSSGNYYGVSSVTSLVGTNGATFYITGVQLEAGSVATPFERRSYGQELALCQRYYWRNAPGITAVDLALGITGNTTSARVCVPYPAIMRSAPTFTVSSLLLDDEVASGYTVTAVASTSAGLQSARVLLTSSGMTGGRAVRLITNSSSAYIDASAEL